MGAIQLPVVESNDNFSDDPEVWDLIVVGAGVAGSAFGFVQGKDGRRVLVLERDLAVPDRIVGELLQPGGYLTLKKLGLSDCVEGIDAQKVYGYALLKDGQEAVVAYPIQQYSADVAGRSFHHGRFVQKLRAAAASLPNVTLRKGFVRRLLNDQGGDWEEGQVVAGVAYKSSDGSERVARGHLTVVCDGMYSKFRSNFVQTPIRVPSYFVGLKLSNCKLPHSNHGHVILAKPSPILFYPISSTEVRCLVDVPGEKLPSDAASGMASYLKDVVAAEVPPSMRASFIAAVDSGDIRSMANKQISASPLLHPGALLLGDAFNMRHPLTGGGMTVALADCALLCDMLQPLRHFNDALATTHAAKDFYIARKPVSATINTLANALYRVFCCTGSAAHEHMRQAAFDYLKLGGIYSSGPVSLLSGLNPKPLVLVAHFFMVAIYGVRRLLLPRPTLQGVRMALALLWIACGIIFPIIRAEGPIAVFAPKLAKRPPVQRPLSS